MACSATVLPWQSRVAGFWSAMRPHDALSFIPAGKEIDHQWRTNLQGQGAVARNQFARLLGDRFTRPNYGVQNDGACSALATREVF